MKQKIKDLVGSILWFFGLTYRSTLVDATKMLDEYSKLDKQLRDEQFTTVWVGSDSHTPFKKRKKKK